MPISSKPHCFFLKIFQRQRCKHCRILPRLSQWEFSKLSHRLASFSSRCDSYKPEIRTIGGGGVRIHNKWCWILHCITAENLFSGWAAMGVAKIKHWTEGLTDWLFCGKVIFPLRKPEIFTKGLYFQFFMFPINHSPHCFRWSSVPGSVISLGFAKWQLCNPIISSTLLAGHLLCYSFPKPGKLSMGCIPWHPAYYFACF